MAELPTGTVTFLFTDIEGSLGGCLCDQDGGCHLSVTRSRASGGYRRASRELKRPSDEGLSFVELTGVEPVTSCLPSTRSTS
jgi:hypothetical protein